MSENKPAPKFILLADDDADDRMLFEEALKEIDKQTQLTTANDGEELMDILDKKTQSGSFIIFLDLNMPKKNGFECLKQIRETENLKDVPVIVYSTSCQEEAINKMYEYGASYYICKPNNFKKLKTSIQHIFSIDRNKLLRQPSKKDFVISY